MDLLQQLDAVIEEVRKAKRVRFSASAMINKQELLQRLEKLRARAPEELLQAGSVVKDRDALMVDIQQQSQQMIAEAEAERDRILQQDEVVRAAQGKAGEIIEEAKQRAYELRMDAEDYVDSRLASFEVILQKTLAVVNRGRESLKGKPGDDTGENVSIQPTSSKESRR